MVSIYLVAVTVNLISGFKVTPIFLIDDASDAEDAIAQAKDKAMSPTVVDEMGYQSVDSVQSCEKIVADF